MIQHPEPTAELQPSEELRRELEEQGIAEGSYRVQRLDAVRKTVARRLMAAYSEIPHFPLRMRIAADALLDARERRNAGEGERVSLNDLFIKAAALAIARFPGVNVTYTSHGIILHRQADISVAVAIEGGLITPIVRAAESRSIAEISADMKRLADAARRKRLQPAEYFGGTFSISNLGMFGISEFSSILNPPQSCILSLGAPQREYCPDEYGNPRLGQIMTATLTCDHRAVDGATGAQWLQAFKDIVENPSQWIDV
ncbi:hypothetical protein ASE06_15575 [Sphingopyxis sp. Root214]|uniref:dihydrolipoamide acetyltransferase family protein n=1 Tax=unclassified Sphingopyxis TaxID=2614943 RepID=UPI0006F21E53|nr:MULTISPECIES: dihydrolipoamide acetyltransferase family protein [unclassified Sphingopyxis]KQZ73756.1 hypothetical protein ASD73_13230 [Sphingopyxis sp. Root154]KRC07897.1 hypothetical protein ASE06_15575 [Sphingopyxis sp. Root214]